MRSAHTPSVDQVAVIAIPDEKWGEAVHAVVVPHEGQTCCRIALGAHVREQIAGFKAPRSFAFVDAMPLSAAGKVLKNVLRDQYRCGVDAAASGDDVMTS